MLIISGLNGNLKVISDKNNNLDGKLITLQADVVTRIGAASHFEEEAFSTKCKSVSFVGKKVNSIAPSCPLELYIIENGEGFAVFSKEQNDLYVGESLCYINRMASTEDLNILETLTEYGFKPIAINLNNLLLRNPLDTSKLSEESHGVFDFQFGDNVTNYTIDAIVELETLENRLNGNLFNKKGTLTAVCDFEVNYINPAKTVEDLTEEEFKIIGAITLTNFKYDKAKLHLVPMLFKTQKQFKAFEDSMKAEGRKSITISRPSLHGFSVQTVIHFASADEIHEPDSTISKVVIFPTSVATTLLVNEFE